MKIAQVMLAELKVEVAAMKAMHGIVPGLAVVIVGERKDSQAYVRMKKKAAKVSVAPCRPPDTSHLELTSIF